MRTLDRKHIPSIVLPKCFENELSCSREVISEHSSKFQACMSVCECESNSGSDMHELCDLDPMLLWGPCAVALHQRCYCTRRTVSHADKVMSYAGLMQTVSKG